MLYGETDGESFISNDANVRTHTLLFKKIYKNLITLEMLDNIGTKGIHGTCSLLVAIRCQRIHE